MKYDRSKFEYSPDKGVFHNANGSMPMCPSVLIKGNRMVHASFGKDAYGFNWAASTLNHWHCIVDMTFDKAYLWVLDGTGDDAAWFQPKENSRAIQ